MLIILNLHVIIKVSNGYAASCITVIPKIKVHYNVCLKRKKEGYYLKIWCDLMLSMYVTTMSIIITKGETCPHLEQKWWKCDI
jgi:hypothetical protein